MVTSRLKVTFLLFLAFFLPVVLPIFICDFIRVDDYVGGDYLHQLLLLRR